MRGYGPDPTSYFAAHAATSSDDHIIFCRELRLLHRIFAPKWTNRIPDSRHYFRFFFDDVGGWVGARLIQITPASDPTGSCFRCVGFLHYYVPALAALAILKDSTMAASSSETCDADSAATKSRILFGSCSSQEYPQRLWPVMASRNATAFVWAGDAIYADRNSGFDFSHFPPKTIVEDATPERLRQLYAEQLEHEGYKSFAEQTYITGTWDDHDYGINNGDERFRYKRESAVAFVDFLGEPRESPMAKRARDGYGVYGVKLFDFARERNQIVLSDDEAGIDPDVVDDGAAVPYSDRSVAVFVLDVRSFKTPWSVGKARFRVNPEGKFLGDRQWKWFEEALGRSKAAINVVVQGLQVHADRYPDGNVAENWSKFPGEQHRLYDMLLQTDAPALLVSGDVHMAELSRKDCHSRSTGAVKSLNELTTSGLTHSWGTKYCSRPSSSFLCKNSYFTWVAGRMMHWAHWINPLTDIMLSEDGRLQYSLELNFAEMEFDWDKRAVIVNVIGKDGDIFDRCRMDIRRVDWEFTREHGWRGGLCCRQSESGKAWPPPE